MSERTIKLEITGQFRGFQTTLLLDSTQTTLSDDIKLLASLLEQGETGFAGKVSFPPSLLEDTITRLAKELDSDPSTLKPLIGYKDGMVQIAKASQLQLTDALCMLLFAHEKGFSESATVFEHFESLVRQNGIKLNYPLSTAIFDLKKRNYINAKLYEEEKKLSLSHLGEENARSAFKDYVAGKGARRLARVPKKSHQEKKALKR